MRNKKTSTKTFQSKKEQEAYRRVMEKMKRCGLPEGVLPDGLQRMVAYEMYLMDMERKTGSRK